MLIEQLGRTTVSFEPKAAMLERLHEARGTDFLAKCAASGERQSDSEIERCRQLRQAQVETFDGMSQIERQAAQELFRLGTDEAYQTECFVIGADEDVLAVIQCLAVDGDTARSATEMPGRFEQCDASAGGAQFNRCGKSCPATTDDRDAARHRHRFNP